MMQKPASAQKIVSSQASTASISLKAAPQVDNRVQTIQLRRLQAAMQRKAGQAPPTSVASRPAVSKLPQPAAGRAVVQRVPLGIRGHAPDSTELDSNEMDGLGRYITQNAASGRQDLNRLLVETVRAKDRAKLSQVQGLVNANNTDDTLVAVPKTIHMIWVGDSIKEGDVQNITSIHSKLPEGWKLKLWTDADKCGFLESEHGRKLQSLPEDGKFSIERTLESQIDERVLATYKLALLKTAHENGDVRKGGATMMSDLGRYSVLFKEGGVYMDTDLNLGSADLSAWDMRMSDTHGIPAFGPNIQFIKDMEDKLKIELATLSAMGELSAPVGLHHSLEASVKQAFDKMFTSRLDIAGDASLPQSLLDQANDLHVLASDEALSVKTRIAAYERYMLGELNNNFVAAPKNHAFMDSFLETIQHGLTHRAEGTVHAYDVNDFDPAWVSAYTGPLKLVPAIAHFYKNKGEEASADGSINKKALMNPQWVSQIAHVGWLTEVHKAIEQRRQETEQERLKALRKLELEEQEAASKCQCIIC